MASIKKPPSGHWRMQVRRKGHRLSNSFQRHLEARASAREQERRIDTGETPSGKPDACGETLADLIDLHFRDLAELGRVFGRSREHALERSKASATGKLRVSNISRDTLVQHAKTRVKDGAGPVTIGIDISSTGTILEHAAAVHGIAVPVEQLHLARIALHRLGLIAKSAARDRRPTTDELAQIIASADANPRQIIPLMQVPAPRGHRLRSIADSVPVIADGSR
jgi:hypothetical protein